MPLPLFYAAMTSFCIALISFVASFAVRAHFTGTLKAAAKEASGCEWSVQDVVSRVLQEDGTPALYIESTAQEAAFNPSTKRLYLLKGSDERRDMAALSLGLHEAGHASWCCAHASVKSLLLWVGVVRGLAGLSWAVAFVLTVVCAFTGAFPHTAWAMIVCHAVIVVGGVLACVLEADASRWAMHAMEASLQLGTEQLQTARSVLCNAFAAHAVDALNISAALMRPYDRRC